MTSLRSSKPQNVYRGTWSDLSNIDGSVNSVRNIVYKLLLEQQIKTNIFHIRHNFSQLNTYLRNGRVTSLIKWIALHVGYFNNYFFFQSSAIFIHAFNKMFISILNLY